MSVFGAPGDGAGGGFGINITPIMGANGAIEGIQVGTWKDARAALSGAAKESFAGMKASARQSMADTTHAFEHGAASATRGIQRGASAAAHGMSDAAHAVAVSAHNAKVRAARGLAAAAAEDLEK
jgi:hypothetical protein